MSDNTRRYIALAVLSIGSAASYALVYIKYIFYDAWVGGLGLATNANESAGMLLTYYTIGNILLYIPGGYIADRFSPKIIIILSLCGTGILSLWYAFDPTYGSSRIIWLLLAFTTGFAFWAASIKAVRMLGTPQEQGRMYGWFNAGEGLFASIILGLATFFYGLSQLAAISLQYAVFAMAACSFLAALLTWIFLDEKLTCNSGDASEEEKFRAAHILTVLKNPWVWACSILIMCTYGAYTGQSYLTPYMTQVLGVSATTGALLGILRTKGARFVGGPIGGLIADRIGSPCKVIIGSNILMVIMLACFFVFPMHELPFMAIGLSLLIALVNFAGYNIMFATVEEAHIPRYVAGTAIGVISICGYAPDGIINTVFGYWLDAHGDLGHIYIFAALIGMCVVSSFMCVLVMRHHQTVLKAQAQQSGK